MEPTDRKVDGGRKLGYKITKVLGPPAGRGGLGQRSLENHIVSVSTTWMADVRGAVISELALRFSVTRLRRPARRKPKCLGSTTS
ncbi:hypothetical protein PoB_003742500 [Plakobranchus ocellatus]|uniref:Uncharacterized protein n=1 Tax=Plakobranchus ocellatus TaxID=259542 RepID=A0AAV4AVK8_9GAST|nr:hypothetical protein PoB_003742500 [Plakobranchus ocellatus]